MEISKFIESIEQEIISYRRYFHKHPELSKKEYNTQKKIMSILRENNIEFVTAATTGVVATIKGSKQGKCVAIRADIDALPIVEQSTCEYASLNKGVMHACGHDAHTAILLGAAITLQQYRESFSGIVKCIFQPDEEVSAGAKRIVEEGFMKNPQVDSVIGLHVMPNLESGVVELKHDQLNASTDSITLTVRGKQAHAAYPHLGIDAMIVGSHVLLNLQALVSRYTSPTDSIVLSFGTIQGGLKPNIIPDTVTMKGTLRCLTQETRVEAKEQIIKIATNTAHAFSAECDVAITEGYIPLINDNSIVDLIEEVCRTELAKEKVVFKEFPSMGAEDFSYYQSEAKGAFYHLGCGNVSKGITAGLHTNNFDIDESCLKTGVIVQVKTALKLLED